MHRAMQFLKSLLRLALSKCGRIPKVEVSYKDRENHNPEGTTTPKVFQVGDRVAMWSLSWKVLPEIGNTRGFKLRVGTVLTPGPFRWSSGNWIPESWHYKVAWDDGNTWPDSACHAVLELLTEKHAGILLAQ